MLIDEVDKFWTEEFGDNLPISNELRSKFGHRWFRIHTLPNSKRYAENESEYAEILSRHNIVLEDLFNSKERIILISCSYSEKSEPTKNPKLVAMGLQEDFWRTINQGNDEETEKYFCHLFVDEKHWKNGLLDELFRLVAEDEVNEVMIISDERNFVYHPYDGGADVILKDSFTRDSYKQKYKRWLSARPDGL